MASLLSNPALRSRLLQLPPALRTSAYQSSIRTSVCRPSIQPTLSTSSTCARRAFSATARRPAADVTPIVVAPFTIVLDSIHALGLPWYSAIPVVAVMVRGFFGYYFCDLPARRRNIIRTNLTPLTTVRANLELAQWSARPAQVKLRSTSPGAFKLRAIVKGIISSFRRAHEVGKIFRAPMITASSFLNFGMMIAFTEAIRIKCGSREGLLTFVTYPLEVLKEIWQGKPKEVDPHADMSPEEILAERLEQARAAATEAKQASPDTMQNTSWISQELPSSSEAVRLPSLEPNAYFELMDPSLAAEGFSWCQDLTLADSSFVLPLAMSATMVVMALFRPAVEAKKVDSSQILAKGAEFDHAKAAIAKANEVNDKAAADVRAAVEVVERINADTAKSNKATEGYLAKLSNSQRTRLSLSIVFFFVACKLPAAVLLYLIPTMLTGWLRRRWMDIKYPLPAHIKPCKRKVRVRVRKELADT